ncbi:MAG: lipid A deacylase LpxR family protein [Cyclobacteriaceae bacterium]|jgi:lipid A 3-O-deacylase|nr:lipid A deacylase LpxR family protein [Cyclobacteriaceae bacterium]
MKLASIITLYFVCGFFPGLSQDKEERKLTNEVTLAIDNDIFFGYDRYYTAGQLFSYRRLLESKSHGDGHQTSKTILNFQLGNKIFTPKRTQFVNPINMDRPYAGFNFISASVLRSKYKRSLSHFGIELGLVGEITGVGRMQQWWHKQTGFNEPSGWDSQIVNEFVLNTNYLFQKSFSIVKGADLVSTSGLFLGTGSNKISQNLTLRFIDFNSIDRSIFSNTRLAHDGDLAKREFFLFYGVGVDYVISDIFLEGSLFNNRSPFTVRATPWVARSNAGLMYAKNRISYSLSVNAVSKEMQEGSWHKYVSLGFSTQF